jgi:hypothetical protein
MIWTRKKPTRQGWYWYRHDSGEMWIEQVRWMPHIDGGKRLAAMGIAGHCFVCSYGGEWAGPIPIPKEQS